MPKTPQIPEREARRAYERGWYARNKRARISANERWEQRNREFYRAVKKSSKCAACGESESCCLEFHHLDPSKKDGHISHMVRHWGKARMLAEIAKCVIVCSNCHAKIHAGLIVLGCFQQISTDVLSPNNPSELTVCEL